MRTRLASLLTLSILCVILTNSSMMAQPATTPAANNAPNLNTQGAVTAGFELTEIRPVKELDGTARLFVHQKTGARLLYLSNTDDNKVFVISFRTIPTDNTGVPHILEHALLNGSRKFPSKEPFAELLKGSVKTFVNAFTFPDKTAYPVASRNDKDFLNLMDVYMDAVFYPLIHTNPYTLKQEGWRYEINEKTGELQYNGVVYNEMKGALSSPDRLLGQLAQKSLFPNNTYGFESGGDPARIPQLTQEAFSAFHHRFYHPSASYILIYGNGNIEEHLKFLDSQYLKEFSKKQVDVTIPLQPAFDKAVEITEPYSINPGESTKGKGFMSLNYAIGRASDPELYLACDILEYLLLETDASPLKRALLEAGIGKNVGGLWDPSMQQPAFEIIIKNGDVEKKRAFKETVEQTLKTLVEKGIDPKLLEAAVNRKEFLLREFETPNWPKGLAYYEKIMDSWMNGGDPLAHLQFEPTLAKIKSEMNKGYFEKLIQKHLLENKHQSLVVLEPRPGLDQEKAQALATKLKAFKDSLKPEELAKIKADGAELKRRQSAPDRPEDLEKIPLLKLSDINPGAEELPRREATPPGAEFKLFHHSVFTSGIVYLDLYFDLSGADAGQVQALSLLSRVLGKLDTDKRSFAELSNEQNAQTGGMYQYIEGFSQQSMDNLLPKYVVRTKALASKLPRAIDLLEEVLLHSKLDNPRRLHEIVRELRTHMEGEIGSVGHRYAMKRVMSYLSKTGAFNELASGVAFYQYLVQVEKQLESDPQAVVASLKQAAALAFSRTGLLVSCTQSDPDFKVSQPQLEKLAAQFPARTQQAKSSLSPRSEKNEGLMIPSKVSYVAKAADFRKLGFEYRGTMQVLSKLLAREYLWNEVRVKGGAYGAVFVVTPQGALAMASYRDPNLTETLECYANSAQYLRKLELPPREMTKFILGTISDLDMPLTPAQKGLRSMTDYISGISQADLQKVRDDVLATRPADLQKYAELIDKAMKENAFAVIGNAQKIQSKKEIFGKLVQVVE